MRFNFAYGRLTPLLQLMAIGPNNASIELTAESLDVRMGWAFKTSVPRSSITNVHVLDKKVMSIGVHGWAGRWLVNGAGDRLVQIDIEPRAKARTAFIPLKLRELTLSLENPAEFTQAITNR